MLANIERLGAPERWDAGLALTGLLANPFAPALVQPQRKEVSEQPPAPSPLQEAAALVARARVQEALVAYEHILAGDPYCVEAWFQIGVLRLEEGDVPGALQAWEQASTRDPAHWVALLRRGMTLASLGRRVEAARCMERALPHAPERSETRIQLSAVYAALNWSDLAVQVLEKLPGQIAGWWAQVRRDNAGLVAEQERLLAVADRIIASGQAQGVGRQLERARVLLSLGRMDECDDALSRLLSERPHGLRIHEVKSLWILRQHGAEQALAYVQNLSERARSGDGYLSLLASMEQEAGHPADAFPLLSAINAASPRCSGYRACANQALAADDEERLSATVESWLAFEARDPWASRFSIAAARRSGATSRLAAALEAATAEPSSSASLLPIVQFWGGMAAPDDVAATMATWQQHNPRTQHLVFDSTSARAFIAGHSAPAVLACYDRATHPAMQSDIFRLAFLASEGGIYVDADEACCRSLDDIQAVMHLVEFVAWLAPETPPYVFNGFLAARAGCPVITWALEQAVRNVAAALEQPKRPDIWQLTGPGLMTRAVGHCLADPGFRGRAMLLTDQEYRAFGRTMDLAYKETRDGNWRLA